MLKNIYQLRQIAQIIVELFQLVASFLVGLGGDKEWGQDDETEDRRSRGCDSCMTAASVS